VNIRLHQDATTSPYSLRLSEAFASATAGQTHLAGSAVLGYYALTTAAALLRHYVADLSSPASTDSSVNNSALEMNVSSLLSLRGARIYRYCLYVCLSARELKLKLRLNEFGVVPFLPKYQG